ncbi:MAG: hypothetical protein SNG14_03240 [Rikenellaceae bacterium]
MSCDNCRCKNRPNIGRGASFNHDGDEIEATIHEDCYKLHETNYLSEYPDNIPTDIVEIRFKNTRRSYYQNVNGLEMSDPLLSEEKLGRGDTKGGSGWYLKNRIGVKLQSRSTLQEAATQRKCVTLGRSGIYIARQLLSKGETKPLATYTNGGYTGGYSSHLPQYIFINFE